MTELAGTGPARPRIAVIGAGVMGAYHARVIAQSERCDLALVVDPEPERLDEPTTVREIVTLEAVVQRVRAERGWARL